MGLARRAVLPIAILIAAAGSAAANGQVNGGEPVPQGPPVAPLSKSAASPPPSAAAMPDDRAEAIAEVQYVDGDPYGRSDYWPEGRGERRGMYFGPGFYERGYYHPGQRQFPDYWGYDANRNGPGSIWTTLYHGVVDPFVPTQREIDFVRALPVRVVTKLRIDEDLRRLNAMAKSRRGRDDGWAGGRYDRPIK